MGEKQLGPEWLREATILQMQLDVMKKEVNQELTVALVVRGPKYYDNKFRSMEQRLSGLIEQVVLNSKNYGEF